MRRLTLSSLALVVALVAAACQRPAAHRAERQSAASLDPRAATSVHRVRRPSDGSIVATPSETRTLTPDAVREQLRLHEAGTYIGEILLDHDSALARWPDRLEKPLTVWVQPESDVPAWQPRFVTQVRHAFREWEALGIPVRFEFVADSAHADVHVSWLDHFDEPISGKTLWARDDRWWIVDGNIQIAVHHSGGTALDAPAIKAIALHEVGHLLGLDHTSDATNIMTPRIRVRELSAADRATLRLLYSLPPGAVR